MKIDEFIERAADIQLTPYQRKLLCELAEVGLDGLVYYKPLGIFIRQKGKITNDNND